MRCERAMHASLGGATACDWRRGAASHLVLYWFPGGRAVVVNESTAPVCCLLQWRLQEGASEVLNWSSPCPNSTSATSGHRRHPAHCHFVIGIILAGRKNSRRE